MWKRSTSLSCSRLHKNIPSLLGDETCCSWDSRRMEFEYRIPPAMFSKHQVGPVPSGPCPLHQRLRVQRGSRLLPTRIAGATGIIERFPGKI
ncbi:hypothetical protein KC359_g155 [Hortaea werneckii]|nr:hypothetical protein KC359_g155 [Hortaea werneckii]